MKNKKNKKQTALRRAVETRPSTVGWVIILTPILLNLFLLFFGGSIPFLQEQRSQEAREAAITVWQYGQELLRSGNSTLAHEQFNKALEIDPELTEAYVSLANIYYSRRDYDRAIDLLKRALSYDPPQKDLIMNNLGLLYAQKREYNKAIETFRRALQTGVNLEQVYGNMGSVYMQTGAFERASEMYKLSLESKPTLKSMYREMLYKVIVEYRDDKEHADACKSASRQYESGLSEVDLSAYDAAIVERFGRDKERQIGRAHV